MPPSAFGFRCTPGLAVESVPKPRSDVALRSLGARRQRRRGIAGRAGCTSGLKPSGTSRAGRCAPDQYPRIARTRRMAVSSPIGGTQGLESASRGGSGSRNGCQRVSQSRFQVYCVALRMSREFCTNIAMRDSSQVLWGHGFSSDGPLGRPCTRKEAQ